MSFELPHLLNLGALACAAAVGLGAYASHGASGEAQSRLGLAALFAFGHGLALFTLSPRANRKFAAMALSLLALGLCLFSGSLVAAVFLGTPTTLAPAGGLLLIAGWVMLAIDILRD